VKRYLGLSPAGRILAVAVVHGVVALGFLGLWLSLMVTGETDASDYTTFYTGGTIIREGQGERLYDLVFQSEIQQRILDGRRFEDGVNPFNLPPHLALPFVPLTLLPLAASYRLWSLLQLGLLALALWWLNRRLAAGWSRRERLLLTGAVLAWQSLLITLAQGSLSLLLLVCGVALCDALARRREMHAAAWLVVASIKPQVAAGPALLLLGARRWRALLVAGGLAGALAVLAVPQLGPATWLDYARHLSHFTATFDQLSVKPSVMWNLRGTLTLMLGREQAALVNTLSYVGLLLASGLIVWLWRGPWRPGTPAFDLRLALTLTLALLTNPHFNPHDGLLLVLPAVLGYRALRGDDYWRGRYACFILSCPLLTLVSNPVSANPSTLLLPARVPVLLAVYLAAVLALALYREARSGLTSRASIAAAAGD
jgi:hypothetical protein